MTTLAESNERLKIRLSFWKFLLGTVALGVITAVLDASYKDRAISLEVMVGDGAHAPAR